MADESVQNENRAYVNAWIVYINGLEVPVSSVAVSYGVGQIPQAEIVLVPDPVVQRFGAEDRISTQIFYCDFWMNPEKPEFRLLFDGEIVGWSYVNTQRGRTLSLMAIDYIRIFTQIFFFFMSNVDDLAIGASGRMTGVDQAGVHTAGLATLFPYSLFAQGVLSPGVAEGKPPLPAEVIQRPIDYVYNLVRGLIQSNIPNRSVPAAAFFAPWVRRTQFHNRFVALPYLEQSDRPGIFPILRAVQAQYAVQAVQQMTSNIGSSGSLWEVFSQVLQVLMMELSMLPTAPAVQSEYATLQILGPAVKNEATSPVFLGNYFVKPQFLFGLPPTCNVLFPSQVMHFSYEENYETQPTRLYVNDESGPTFLNTQNMTQGLYNMVRDALTVAYPEDIHQAMQASMHEGAHNLNGKNVLLYPEEFFRGPVVKRMRAPLWFTFLNRSQNTKIDLSKGTEAEQAAQAREVLPGDSERNIYKKYAAYEYIKERYARRSASVTLSGFNPYPVPGFPCAVFDRRSTQVDIFGYVTHVQHRLSAREVGTSLGISYGRTFSEAFGALRAQVDAENALMQRDHAEAMQRINQATGTAPADAVTNLDRVGAIALGPPEPIQEIRDVVQNFDRAEAFYQSLFFCQAATTTDQLSQTQLQTELSREQVTWAAPGIRSTDVPRPPPAAPPRPTKPASFYYPNVIQFATDQDTQAVQIHGMDSTTRVTLVTTLQKMRVGKATEEEIAFVNTSLQGAGLTQNKLGEVPSPEIMRQLNTAEELVQNWQTRTNVRGDAEIVPHPSALPLFESQSLAMEYNARPVCTLEEYLLFLGPDASPEGRVEANSTLTSEDVRTFPAPYYQRIRYYRPGPPPVREPAPLSSVDDPSLQVEAVPDDFPDRVTDWDALLMIYRSNVLSRMSPGK